MIKKLKNLRLYDFVNAGFIFAFIVLFFAIAYNAIRFVNRVNAQSNCECAVKD